MTIPRPTNIRTRLAIWFVGILAGILALYIMAVFSFQYILLQRQIFHDEIQDVETVEGLLYFDAQGILQLREDYHSHAQSRLLEDRLMEVRDESGFVLYRSQTLGSMLLGGPIHPGEGVESYDERSVRLVDGRRVLVISHLHPIGKKPVLIRLGYSLAPLHERMLRFFLMLLLATPIALVLAGFAGYSIARRALRPIDFMATRAEQIGVLNLNDRIVIKNPNDEIGRMARVMNHLLERVEQAFLQLQRFTADAAHELRTPLASIRMIGESGLDQQRDTTGYRETIGSMLEETIRLNQTIDGLLLLAKAEIGKVDNQQTEFSLPRMVNEILTLLEVLLDERAITIEITGEEKLTEPLVADRSLIRMAVLNALHNAVKFTPSGSPIVISYELVDQAGQHFQQLCIHDSGPGIAAGEYDRVFDRFFTSHSPLTSSGSGAGLGLSIAKLIITRANGRIYFAQKPPEYGARCCIELPVMTPVGKALTPVLLIES